MPTEKSYFCSDVQGPGQAGLEISPEKKPGLAWPGKFCQKKPGLAWPGKFFPAWAWPGRGTFLPGRPGPGLA